MASVSEAWTRWIRDHHPKIQEIVVLSGNRLVTLIISAAKIFSRTGELMTVVDQEKPFYALLEKAAPNGAAFVNTKS